MLIIQIALGIVLGGAALAYLPSILQGFKLALGLLFFGALALGIIIFAANDWPSIFYVFLIVFGTMGLLLVLKIRTSKQTRAMQNDVK